MIRIYCSNCDTQQPLEIEPLRQDELNGDKIWGDLLCAECHLVIATITADKVGEYEIVKVSRDHCTKEERAVIEAAIQWALSSIRTLQTTEATKELRNSVSDLLRARKKNENEHNSKTA